MTLEQMARGATQPWFSLDAVAEEWDKAGLPVLTSKDMADVFECMNCTREECCNCKGGGTGRPVGRPRKIKAEVDGQLEIA